MEKNYNLYVGLNDKDLKMQVVNSYDAIKLVNNLLLFKYKVPAFTINQVQGVYTHEDGEVVIENTLQIIFKFIEDDAIHQIVKELKALLNQESIMVEEIISNITFE